MRERPQDYSLYVRSRLEPGFQIPATAYLEALNLRAHFLAGLMRCVFDKADVLHTPVMSVATPTVAETEPNNSGEVSAIVARLTRNTRPVNYFGLPALSVPAGFSSAGLPVAFQLIGRPFRRRCSSAPGTCTSRRQIGTSCLPRSADLIKERTMRIPTRFDLRLSVWGAALLTAEVLAQGYPVKPVRVIDAYPPGGGTDIVARTIAPKFQESLGQPWVIDNRGGAQGIIGAEGAARSPADGYTLLMFTTNFTIHPAIYK
jgi:hypothetical protein